MFDHEIQWLCGVIDAEGSFILTYAKAERKRHCCKIRRCYLKILTTDSIIIPKVCEILKCHYQPRPSKLSVRITGSQLRLLLPKLIPYLYTKQPQAKLALAALNIKNGQNSFYSEAESQLWHSYYKKVRQLNQVGKKAINDVEPREHIFSWPWLAGMTDGDGTIINGRFGLGGHSIKPIYKISLAHLLTIDYLGGQLGVGSLRSGGGKGNKRPLRAIRLMADKQREILPKIIPYLQLKREQAEIALKIAMLRHSLPPGTNRLDSDTGDKIKILLSELDRLNASSGKSRHKITI
jgi:hypothetical protein